MTRHLNHSIIRIDILLLLAALFLHTSRVFAQSASSGTILSDTTVRPINDTLQQNFQSKILRQPQTLNGGRPIKHRIVYEAAYTAGSVLKIPVPVSDQYMQAFQIGIGRQFEGQDYPYDSYISAILTYQDYSHPIVKEEHAGLMNRRGLGHFLAFGVSIRHHYWQNKWYSVSGIVENGYAYQFSPYATLDRRYTQSGLFQIYFNAGFLFTRTINRRHDISMGPQFTHFSNSGTHLPNNGINSFTWSLRYHYYVGEPEEKGPKEQRQESRLRNRHFYLDARTGVGINARNKSADSTKIVNSMHASCNTSLALMYRINVRHGLGLGLDYFYNPTGAVDGKQNFLGLGLKHESFYHRLGIHVNLGYYLNESHYKSLRTSRRTRIYEQIGIRWYFAPDSPVAPYMGYFVKGNGGFYAENFEINIGFRLAKCKKKG